MISFTQPVLVMVYIFVHVMCIFSPRIIESFIILFPNVLGLYVFQS